MLKHISCFGRIYIGQNNYSQGRSVFPGLRLDYQGEDAHLLGNYLRLSLYLFIKLINFIYNKLVTLTIPSDLRKLFIGKWDLLKILQDSAYEAIELTACKTLRKNVKIGILVGIQTYGQDMKFHPHL